MEEVKMTVGENIRRIRKELGLTQKALGQLCNINESQIRRYELGLSNSNPKIETIRKIADALGVSIYELTGELEDMVVQQVTEYNGLNSILTLLENAGYKILQTPCLLNHGDWNVRTITPDNSTEQITAAFNEKLQILTKGCISYKQSKRICESCENMQVDNFIIQKGKKKISITIDEMQKHFNDIVKYTDFLFS